MELKNREERIFDFVSSHLPSPPAAVLAAGLGADACLNALRQRGYQVARLIASNEPTDKPAYEICALSGDPVSLSHVGEHPQGFSRQYDAILLWGGIGAVDTPDGILAHARGRLREGGAAVICDEIRDDRSVGGDLGMDLFKKTVTALYESGFSIQFNDRIREGIAEGSDGHGQGKGGTHLIAARKDGLFLRAYRDKDEDAILEMFREVFKADRKIGHWYWKFRDNPFGAYRIAEAFAADRTLAGHYSGYPVPFHASAGREFLSYQIGDIMTRPGFRQVGLANTSVLGRLTDYFHHKFCLGSVPFMYGFVAGNHKRFGERFLRYTYMSGVPYYVLAPAGSRLNVKGRAAAFLSGFSVKPVTEMTPEFDIFFREVSEAYGLLVKRDAAYLKWRYLDCPDNRHTLFAARRLGRLAGWGVFSRRDDALIWGDALFRKRTDVRAVRILLDHVLTHLGSDVARIEAWFSPVPRWWTKLLSDLGFRVIDEPNKLVSGVTIFDRSFSLEWIQENLYYTMGDSDLF